LSGLTKANSDGTVSRTIDLESVSLVDVLGPSDSIFRAIEQHYPNLQLSIRGNKVSLRGDEQEVLAASALIVHLEELASSGHPVSLRDLDKSFKLVADRVQPTELLSHSILSSRGRSIRPKTLGQKNYVEAIDNHTIVFGIGPAGTGKTYLAIAKAVQALQRKEISRIILTRPAVEAGEKLGFLPGTLSDKIDPYLRPLFDALTEMLDADSIPKLLAAGTIEVAPLAYMRGRTLNDSFIILDEAQNTTPGQMKMFLTRLGFNSKMVITGDITQVDLPIGTSGLRTAPVALAGIDDVSFAELTSADVVRHSLVSRIVDAYTKFEEKNQAKKK
jgi:phosphate starvation-inducible PhoH-like protein